MGGQGQRGADGKTELRVEQGGKIFGVAIRFWSDGARLEKKGDDEECYDK